MKVGKSRIVGAPDECGLAKFKLTPRFGCQEYRAYVCFSVTCPVTSRTHLDMASDGLEEF